MIKSGRLDRRYDGIVDCFKRVVKQEGEVFQLPAIHQLTDSPSFQESSHCGAATAQTSSATSPHKLLTSRSKTSSKPCSISRRREMASESGSLVILLLVR
jgi:hypothetical protein